MRVRSFRWLAGVLLAAMLLAIVPMAAGAQGGWERIGQKVWLEPGKGINLLTGGAGEDITFSSGQLHAKHGMQVVSGSSIIDYDLAPATTGYGSTSLDPSAVNYRRVLVRLADGHVAQVRFGMASSSGLIYTGLFLEEWVVMKGALPATGGEKPAEPTKGTVRLKLDQPVVEVNGTASTLDVGPRRMGGQVMLPLRFVGEALGLSLVWDAKEKQVTITGDGVTATLWVDKGSAQINGKSVTLAHPPTMLENRLLVPLTGLGEALAGKAHFDAKTGVITLGSGVGEPATPFPTAPTRQAEGWPAHFSGVWLNGYQDGWFSESPSAKGDFYLSLNADGSARVILTVTTLSYGASIPLNLEYVGTYSQNPLRVDLKLQPALKGWESLTHSDPNWQQMQVTGDLAADMSKIEKLTINGRAAKSGAATRVNRVPEPGEWR